ncbi:MAG: chemotaxis response regulator protein-glutamate methylesterase [Rhizomicrobium sp.]
MKKARVLIIDDSATIRGLLTAILSRDPELEVVGSAPDAATARQMIKELKPDVCTLDIEMPNMSGLEFLEKIMRLRPMPIVMVSTLTKKGAEATLTALETGAVDYFPKPTDNVASHLDECSRELCEKVKTAAHARVRPHVHREPAQAEANSNFDPGQSIIAIGSSTGGVEALIEVLSHFPENCPPTVITQHMPAHFTTTFAERLDRLCRPKVTEAKDGDRLAAGKIYLAPGSEAHLEVVGTGTLKCHLVDAPLVGGHRPSVDVLFDSMARSVRENAIGVILTGMGRDGATGLLAMRKAGAATIGQNQETAIVYGMPRVAFEMNAVEQQLPLEQIGRGILRICELRLQGDKRHASRI